MDKKPQHTFELSGLGSAPFTIVKAQPGNPTFFCEHCGTMLKNRYFVKSAEGRVSVVGVDCLKKTGDIGLLEGINRQKAMEKARKREEEHQARQQNQRQMYGGLTWEEKRLQLKSAWDTSLGALRDWIEDQALYESACSTNFGADVMASVCNGDKVTDNAVKILVEIRAKQISKSRKNSRAYKEKYPEAQAEWGDFFAQYNIKCLEVDSNKQAFLDHHRF
ncbi:hypothetical protein OCT63_17205 [Vibrio sp. RW]|uniref:hypothetical protein n=1 Tax=Vibrio sp. RW TaxID=2998833 RepID=UPI0022CD708A|nr:hypothetical protein [Vibrio sp. RW]MDA0145966.1 hypothetical protein [Vibrio sp. RW]